MARPLRSHLLLLHWTPGAYGIGRVLSMDQVSHRAIDTLKIVSPVCSTNVLRVAVDGIRLIREHIRSGLFRNFSALGGRAHVTSHSLLGGSRVLLVSEKKTGDVARGFPKRHFSSFVGTALRSACLRQRRTHSGRQGITNSINLTFT